MGRGAGGGRLRGLRGKRGVRPRHRAALPRCDPQPRRQPRCARCLHRIPRPRARTCARCSSSTASSRRRPAAREALAAHCPCWRCCCWRPPWPRAGEPLYVVEQVIVSVNSAADGSGERVASLKSGERVELLERAGESVHVRLPDGKEGWLRAIYLSGDAPLKPRLAQAEAEVTRLQAQVGRLQGQLAAATAARHETQAPRRRPPPRPHRGNARARRHVRNARARRRRSAHGRGRSAPASPAWDSDSCSAGASSTATSAASTAACASTERHLTSRRNRNRRGPPFHNAPRTCQAERLSPAEVCAASHHGTRAGA